MKRITATYLTVVLSMFLVACQQNEPMEFADNGRVLFYEMVTHFTGQIRGSEKNVSFTLMGLDVTEADATINVRLMGSLADHDRTFRAELVKESSTAVEGTHFRLHDGIMKAGEYWSQLHVTLYRTADMEGKAVKITLKLVDTDDLGANVDATTEFSTFTLIVADYLLQPANWPTQYFGTYSDNKYRFVMATLGIDDFPFETRWDTGPSNGEKFTISQMYTFQYKLQEAYAAYRAAGNPPIYMDDSAEVKVEISF